MKKTKLKDICNISAGGTPSRSNINYWNNGDIPWCKIGDFSGKYINQVKENITEEGLKNSSAKIFKRGTILYTIFATVGEVAILEIESATNQAIAGLELINNEVDLEYLYYYLKSLKFLMLKKSRGVAQNNINLGILKNIEIKIPDKIEQINIAKILDNIEKIIDKKKKQLKELNAIIKSQFVEMFGDPIINEKNWNVDTIKNVAPRTKYVGKFDAKVWILNLDMIESGTGNIIEYMYEDLEKIKSSTCTFNEEYVLYSKLRPYLNKVVVPIRKGYATSEMIPLKPDITRVEKQFLAYLLRSEQFVNYISLKTIGAKMPRVSMEIFMKFNLILPPLSLQNQFSEIVKQIDKQKFESMIQLKMMEKIYNIINDRRRYV